MTGKALNPKVLSDLAIVGALSPENRNTLARRVHLEEFPAGAALFQKGDMDHRVVYVLRGKVDLVDDSGVVKSITSGTDEGRQPLAQQYPRPYGAVCQTGCIVIRIDHNLLEIMRHGSQSQSSGGIEVSEVGDGGADDGDWMTKVLQSKAVHNIPAANLQALFVSMQEVTKRAGEVVIKQGDEGDYYYVIKAGRCAVVRQTKSNPKGAKLAELGVGDSFGEEALISDSKRNASVVMITPGSLMRLSKADFQTLLNEPMVNWIQSQEAEGLVAEQKAVWIDVRMPNEYEAGHISGSLNLPFYALRQKVESLPKDKTYIVYCDNGSRSASVAYLMAERGFDTRALKGGYHEHG